MYTYTVTHESDDNSTNYTVQTNTKIVEAFYGNGDTVEDPHHLKIVKTLEIEFKPERGEYLSIYLTDLHFIDFED